MGVLSGKKGRGTNRTTTSALSNVKRPTKRPWVCLAGTQNLCHGRGMPVILPRPLLWAVAVSLMFLAVLLFRTDQALSPLYYAVMCGIGWYVLHGDRGPRFEQALQRLPGHVTTRALLFGYAAVIFEETIVGTLYAVNEGNLAAAGHRARQFISFNLLAFTGAIWGLALATRLLPGLSRWHLLIAGGWGLFAERSYLIFFSNPIAGLLIAGPNVAVYSIILAPMVLSMPGHDAPGSGRRLWAPLAAWALMLAISLPAVALLLFLRGTYPGAFPDCAYIACD